MGENIGCEYFLYMYRLDGDVRCLVWCSGESDMFVGEFGQIISFRSSDDARKFAELRGFHVAEETAEPLDLDALVLWIEAFRTAPVDCVLMLDAWNMFDDASKTMLGVLEEMPAPLARLYEKLFWGNNISAATPDGGAYAPAWPEAERQLLADHLLAGLTRFRQFVAKV